MRFFKLNKSPLFLIAQTWWWVYGQFDTSVVKVSTASLISSHMRHWIALIYITLPSEPATIRLMSFTLPGQSQRAEQSARSRSSSLLFPVQTGEECDDAEVWVAATLMINQRLVTFYMHVLVKKKNKIWRWFEGKRHREASWVFKKQQRH